MATAFEESIGSLINFYHVAAEQGLGFSGELSDKIIEQTLPILNNSLLKIQRRLKKNKILDTPLVSSKPIVSSSSSWTDENGIRRHCTSYFAPVETYGCTGNGSFLPESWAYIFIEQNGIMARWKVNKPYRSEDDREPFPLSSRQLLTLWWDAPSDNSAGTGDEGLISRTGRLFYRLQTLLFYVRSNENC